MTPIDSRSDQNMCGELFKVTFTQINDQTTH